MSKLIYLFIFIFSMNYAIAEEDKKLHEGYALEVRGTTSMFSETELLESTINLLSPEINLQKFLTPSLSLTVGLEAYITYSSKILKVWSWKIGFRQYFKGLGSPDILKENNIKIKKITNQSFFWGANFKSYSYFITQSEEDKLNLGAADLENNGVYYSLTATAGWLYRFNSTYSLVTELGLDLVSFSASDSRINQRGTILYYGLQYSF